MAKIVIGLFVALLAVPVAAEEIPDYTRDIAPLLRKYCAGCHNAEEANGELRLDAYAEILKGGEHGPALVAGDAKVSRMIRAITGEADLKMPPEDEKQPSEDEIALLGAWINGGAKGPEGAEPTPILITPKIEPNGAEPQAATSVVYSPDGKSLALGGYRTVEIRSADGERVLQTLQDHPGKVNDLAFSLDGKLLLAATGVTGLYGEVWIWNVGDGSLAAKVHGHRDTLYAVAISPDGNRIATGSYDRRVTIWDAKTRKPTHTLTQHNGAIYDLAFSPDGKLLASASADETVKIWNVATGERLDTLGQPEGEQYAVLFSPDGKQVVAGGADNRIRVWQVVSRDKPRINPLKFARFAHEGAVVALAWNSAENVLISAAEDRTLKAWETKTFTETKLFDKQSDVVTALAASPVQSRFVAVRIDGTRELYDVPTRGARRVEDENPAIAPIVAEGEMQSLAEIEPNNTSKDATAFAAPGTATGVVRAGNDGQADVDCFRFTAKAGQQWIIETKAARMKSPLDTKIEVLDSDGNRIERVLLQAVRDSYFTFRGKDSKQTGDFRVHNWEEMQLNQLLYAQGEVVKLFHYPRGPDSGFDVYPKFGNRHTWFDTTSVSHALGEPCYIVEPHAPSETIIPNGLPVFPIYYENDDDALSKLGTDSRLTFTAPADGEYVVRVKDARGLPSPQPSFKGRGSDAFSYELTIRPPKPDFSVRLEGGGMTVNRGSGKMFTLKADRVDNFDGEIQLEIAGVPEGFHITSPLTIQSGQFAALGAIYAFADTVDSESDAWKKVTITATATVAGKEVRKEIGNLGDVKLAGEPKILPTLSPVGESPVAPGKIPEVAVEPGQTLTLMLRVDRKANNGVLSFGKEDAGRNLPHGVYVDNIGLNGVLLLAGQTEREVFITADDWVPTTSHLFFLKSDQEDGQCTWPLLLRVK